MQITATRVGHASLRLAYLTSLARRGGERALLDLLRGSCGGAAPPSASLRGGSNLIYECTPLYTYCSRTRRGRVSPRLLARRVVTSPYMQYL